MPSANQTISNMHQVLQLNGENKEKANKKKSIEICIIKELAKGNSDLQEKFDVETIAVEALERLISNLNGDHLHTKVQIGKKMKRMQRDYNVKIKQLNILKKREEQLRIENKELCKSNKLRRLKFCP